MARCEMNCLIERYSNCYSEGLSVIEQATVKVENVAPFVDRIIVPIEPIRLNTPTNVYADFHDPGILDTHTAQWDWKDGHISTGYVEESNGSGSVTGSHTYFTPGVYPIQLTVFDKDGGIGVSNSQFIVVYDPDGGFVTGGGWIISPTGACRFESCSNDSTGKANFGFVSKYNKGANIPEGNTEFQFKAGNLNFKSTHYQWLVVAGPKAVFKGVGTINGVGEYGFLISAIDEQLTPSTDVDLFRIKIWDLESGLVVYDNLMGAPEDANPTTAIGGGNIVVHK